MCGQLQLEMLRHETLTTQIVAFYLQAVAKTGGLGISQMNHCLRRVHLQLKLCQRAFASQHSGDRLAAFDATEQGAQAPTPDAAR